MLYFLSCFLMYPAIFAITIKFFKLIDSGGRFSRDSYDPYLALLLSFVLIVVWPIILLLAIIVYGFKKLSRSSLNDTIQNLYDKIYNYPELKKEVPKLEHKQHPENFKNWEGVREFLEGKI